MIMREYRFRLTCRTTTPFHCGAGHESELSDADLRCRADGTLVLPGTSIAGALRAVVERLAGVEQECLLYIGGTSHRDEEQACACRVCTLFGNAHPVGNAGASKISIWDAALAEDVRQRVVDGVGLDRVRRSASDARKFDYTEVEPGAHLEVEVRGCDVDNQELQWLGAALRLLGSGEVPLGGRTARGTGRLLAEKASLRSRDLANPNHLLATISHDNDGDAAWPEELTAGLDGFPGQDHRVSDRVFVEFSIQLAPEATFLIADPAEAIRTGFDHAPRGGVTQAELPAASLRGTLRSGAERILRTLKPEAACHPATDQRCRSPGAAIDDVWCCWACRLFGNEDWASRLSVEVKPEDGADGQRAPFDHVAIDRFTGGAREQRKFDALAVRGRRFHVRLTLDRMGSEDACWMIGLLALTLGDLVEGRLPVGYGSARGHGFFALDAPPRWSRYGDDLQVCIAALWEKLGLRYPGKLTGQGETTA
jgi:CRISPR/Cas system CSM-associated protein Csm3 (group 7 of RAMP superfamily)